MLSACILMNTVTKWQRPVVHYSIIVINLSISNTTYHPLFSRWTHVQIFYLYFNQTGLGFWVEDNLFCVNSGVRYFLLKIELTPWKIWKADISSVSPFSERIEELWVLLVFTRMWKSFVIAGNIVTWICEFFVSKRV